MVGTALVLLLASCSKEQPRSQILAAADTVAMRWSDYAYSGLYHDILLGAPQTLGEFEQLARDAGFDPDGKNWEYRDSTGRCTARVLRGFDHRMVIVTLIFEPKNKKAFSAAMLDLLAKQFKMAKTLDANRIHLERGELPTPFDDFAKDEIKTAETITIGLPDGVWLSTQVDIGWVTRQSDSE